MFDSGVGGLTVLHECLVSLPEEDFVYLGDTAMFPYGTRDTGMLRERIRRIAELLLDDGAKLLVIACNTATSIGEDVAREVAAERGVEVVPVVEPQAEIAAAITANGQGRGAGDPEHGRERRLPAGARGPGTGAGGDRGRGSRPGAVHPGRLAVRRGGDGDGALLLRAAAAGRRRHPDPRLHPLPAGGADAAADPRPRRPPRQRRPRGRRRGPAHARVGRHRPGAATARAPTGSSAAATSSRSASWGPASCRCRSARSRESTFPPPTTLRAMSALEQAQADVRTAMKAGERERAAALRMIVDSLQQDAKLGKGDEVAVLQRERKKRLEAAAGVPRRGPRRAGRRRELRGGADRGLPARAALRRGAGRAGRGGDRRDRRDRAAARWAR